MSMNFNFCINVFSVTDLSGQLQFLSGRLRPGFIPVLEGSTTLRHSPVGSGRPSCGVRCHSLWSGDSPGSPSALHYDALDVQWPVSSGMIVVFASAAPSPVIRGPFKFARTLSSKSHPLWGLRECRTALPPCRRVATDLASVSSTVGRAAGSAPRPLHRVGVARLRSPGLTGTVPAPLDPRHPSSQHPRHPPTLDCSQAQLHLQIRGMVLNHWSCKNPLFKRMHSSKRVLFGIHFML